MANADTPDQPQGDALQFDRAEYAPDATPAALSCASCGQTLSGVYYRVNENNTCERCRMDLEMARRQDVGKGFGRFVRATVFGSLAGALGAAIWLGVRAATGYELGLIALVVGLMVGGAVRAGSRGRGGWPYQTLAVVLTYSAIVSTYVPVVYQALKAQAQKSDAASTPSQAAGSPAAATPATSNEAASAAAAPSSQNRPGPALVVLALAVVVVLAYLAPFLALMEGLGALMGLVIIAIALYEAWKINKRTPLVVSGPYRLADGVSTDGHA